MDQSRRDFIRKSCGLCASLVGVSLVLPALQSCSPLISMKTNVSKGPIQVPKVNFTEENKIVIIKNEPMEFDIALVKLGDDKYRAFELQCTHQSNALIPTKTGFFCNAHGSSFSFEGKVNKPPAERNLREFTIELNSETVNVFV